MIRGRISSVTLLAALLTAGVACAQLPAGPSPDAAAQPAANASQPKITSSETVVVTAPGEFRDEQELQGPSLLEQMPGTSPIKSLAQLPSVNFQAADPYGSYEWAVRISVRGFNQNQLGFTLDDIPLGDMSYGNWNGLHISRAITDENIGRVVLSQGTGALETASTSNLGGTIQFYSADPSDKRSVTLDQSFGSWSAYRTYARFESGLLPSHTKFYITGAYNLADKWRGHGDIGQNYWQLNGKLVHYVGNSGVLSIFADVSDRREVDYQDVYKDWNQKLGYNWDNYGNWSQSVTAGYAVETAYAATGETTCGASGTSAAAYGFPSPVSGLNAYDEDACDAAYYGGSGLRKDVLGGISYKQALTGHLTWKTTAYGHRNDGRGLWFTPYTPTYDNYYSPTELVSPISLRTSEYGISRGGFLTSLAYETGKNKLEGGFWFEGERWNLARRFYGTSASSPLHSLYDFPTNPFYTAWEYVFNTTVYDVHLQDAYKVNDKLALSAGFKTEETLTDGELSSAFKSSYTYSTLASGKYAQGSLTSGKPFLPQFGVNFKLDKHNEVFADASYNVRSYQPGGYGFGNSPWGTTQSGFNALKTSTKPETSWTEEGGFRSTTQHYAAQASYFHVNFSNRLLAFAQGSGIAGNASILSNAGGVTTNGVDGSVSIHITPELTLYNAITWNKSTYDDNTGANGSCIYTDSTTGTCDTLKGKINVDTPEVLYKNSLEYHKAGFFGHIGSDYMSKRYDSYSNDESVGGRFLADFNTGYNRAELGAFRDLKAQFNVSNLLNAQFYGPIGTNGFGYTNPLTADNPTIQVGAPRTVSGTLSVRF
jgi:iron complex outermembrane receptor protein